MTTILTKINHKGLLFEKIQGYVSKRHYILPFLMSKDEEFQEKIKIYNGILLENQLSQEFMNNIFTFISDKMLFNIVNEEKNILKDKNYFEDKFTNDPVQRLKKRIITIYKYGEFKKGINISTNKLQKYLPKNEEFDQFLKDFLLQKGKLKFFDIISKTYINIFDSEKEEISPDEIKTQYKNMNGKVLINLAFIENLKSGKSTIIGHLLYSTGKIDKYSQLYKDAINSAQNNEYKYSFFDQYL